MISLSPREVVMSSRSKHSDEFVSGYQIPYTADLNHSTNFSVPKGKKVSITEEEANRKSLIPSPNSYNLV